MSEQRFDVLVVGSGVAGSFAALHLAARGRARVGVITKGRLEESNTNWAQGGIAAVSDPLDSTESHFADTLRAGAGLCDEAATRVLVEDGPRRVRELVELGAVFDRTRSGELDRGLEGGHSHPRIVHAAGAATGAEVARTLSLALRERGLSLLERWLALDLVVEGGRCVGIEALDPGGAPVRLTSEHVVLATGGAGQLFAVTTNPPEATGDGVAMALRAGLGVADVEFVQFHPTALGVPSLPRPLLSEALRGEGAVLRGATGERFVDELQPRDVVSRAIAAQMVADGTDHVLLDATAIDEFARRFPSLHASLSSVGLDPSRDYLPVAPAAHYLCGGLPTDLEGATELPGLWAAGEVACTGVQGANRLASNSLLEGLVFGARVADAIAAGRSGPERSGVLASAPPALVMRDLPCRGLRPSGTPAATVDLRAELQRAFSAGVGIVRSDASLVAAEAVMASVAGGLGGVRGDRERIELTNLLTLGSAVIAAARARTESRGAHARSDFPEPSEEFFLRQRVVAAPGAFDELGRIPTSALRAPMSQDRGGR